MKRIRPVSDLRNNFAEISRVVHETGEPLFLTKNGYGDMVVMSHAHYEMLINLLELYQKLGEAEALDASGDEGIPHLDMMKRLKERIK